LTVKSIRLRAVIGCLAMLLCVCVAGAQTPVKLGPVNPSRLPAMEFETASVRINPAPIGVYPPPSWSGRRFTSTHFPVGFLIQMAYGKSDTHIHGLPSWDDSTFYDVVAKVGGEGELPTPVRQALLQQLLKERFHLAVHHETKQFAGYELVVVKKQPTLTPGDTPGQSYIYRDKLRLPGVTMTTLAGMLERVVHEPVLDHTGITGTYNINLNYAPMDATDSELPSIFTVLEEQLGLKLVSQKVPVDELMIDRVDRTPTEN
jgi:uncharacterized protein (TIGR03435 family)